ncbi:DUF3137 domain-containing protein [Sphingomonas sp. RP10(2022)]|uniref:DUF3137 domain-containing protein n=1 Tax=Sphingomonas liriopis TaxID=2949094 RepID=A0A9X2KQ61_9SPHN|nr:DUF3137 domain-containing protein [Sphingomonas liriopis]MCP3734650.1 DUF3137 domain-containing protein [Sphingomonas liriopis]
MAATAPFTGGGDAGLRFQRRVVGGVSAALLVGCLVAGHPFNGMVAAAGLWFGADWIIRGVVSHKHQAVAEDDAADLPVPPAMAPILARLEASRAAMMLEIEQRMRTRMPIGLAAGALPWLWSQFGRRPDDPLFLAVYLVVGATAAWTWASGSLASAYRRRYKNDVLTPLAAQLGDLSYRAAVAPDAAMIREQRMFPYFDRLTADDEIVGTYHGVPISIVELELADTRGKSTIIVFDGLFVRIALPRMLSGMTAVVADIGVLTALRDLMGARGAGRVRLEDPVFERLYQVYATDQISARALLTPAFMTRFITLGDRTGFQRPVALAQGNDLTIALAKQQGRDLFEPPAYNRRADSRAALARLHDDLAAVLTVADGVIDLDQSVRGRVAAAANRGA